jgi:hypothetical protein
VNVQTTQTRSQQRIDQLINAGRPLTDDESEELYRALHADYMRKWRAAKVKADQRSRDLLGCEPLRVRMRLLETLRGESAQPARYPRR